MMDDVNAVLCGERRWCVVEGDALALLAALPDASVDAIITDPPYSSGGAFRGDRMRNTDSKYTSTESQGRRPDFAGDNRDQRAWSYWCALWMSECLRVAKPNDARLVAFTDWRQLPSMTDAVQCGGWLWRGIVPWDKTEAARPTPGGFKNQCEYAVWASNGPLPMPEEGNGGLQGCFRYVVKQDDKFHQTGKPTLLMRDIVKVAPRDGVILDPFAGSGTTGVGALLEGRRVILCERVPEIAEDARRRCEAAVDGRDWRRPEQPSLFGGPPVTVVSCPPPVRFRDLGAARHVQPSCTRAEVTYAPCRDRLQPTEAQDLETPPALCAREDRRGRATRGATQGAPRSPRSRELVHDRRCRSPRCEPRRDARADDRPHPSRVRRRGCGRSHLARQARSLERVASHKKKFETRARWGITPVADVVRPWWATVGNGAAMSAASEPAECGDVCPDEVSGRRLPAATALRVVVREDDLRRWAALCVETADYLASDVRTLPTEAAVQVLDTAGDAVRDAAVALWALRLEARRESA